MKIILPFLLLAITATAGQFITCSVTVTNGTATNYTSALSVNGSLRSGAAVGSATNWIGTNSVPQSATNIFAHLGANPVAGVLVSMTSPTNVSLKNVSNVTLTGDWGELGWSTNTTTNVYAMVWPASAIPSAVAIAEGSAINELVSVSTNALNVPVLGAVTQAVTGFIWNPKLRGTVYADSNIVAASGLTFAEGGIARIDTVMGVPVEFTVPIAAHFVWATNGIYGLQGETNDVRIDTPAITSKSLSLLIADTNTTTLIAGPLIVGSTLTTTGAVSLPNLITSTSASITNAVLGGTNRLNGDLSLAPRSVTSLANGNNAGVNVGTNSLIKLSGATTIASIAGFVAGRDGEIHILQISGAVTNTLLNDSGVDPAAANRITTGTGGDLALTNQPAFVTIIYDATASRWRVASFTR